MKNITLQPVGIKFTSDNATSILDAALNSNISLNHSCKTGGCGSCKAVVIEGSVNSKDPHKLLTEQEVNNNTILTCCSNAETDCHIEAEYFPELERITQKTVPAKISEITFPASDVAVIKFRLPPTVEFNFLSGQYLDMMFGGLSRSYSIANKCTNGDGIELHIRKVSGGAMSEKVFSTMAENTLVRLNGPIGTFFIRKSDRPLIFLAGGTGFAPVKAMVEDLIANGDSRPIHIYWGATNPSGLYSELPEIWAAQYSNITFVPVISNNDTGWEGRLGLVHRAVLEDFASLDEFDVYACGSPFMIDAACKDFIDSGLPQDRFYSDAFVASTN